MEGNLQEPVNPSPTQSAYAQNESSVPTIKRKSKYGTWLLFFALFLWLLFILVSFWFIFMRGSIGQALKDAAFTIIMIGIYYPFVARYFNKASDFTKSIILLGGLTIVFVSGFIWVKAYESASVHQFIKNYGMRIFFLLLSVFSLLFGLIAISKRFRAFWYNSQEDFLIHLGVSKHYINTEARANRAMVEKSGVWNNKFLAVTCVILGVLGIAVSIPLFFTSTSRLTFPYDNIDNQNLNQPQQQVQQPSPTIAAFDLKDYDWAQITASESVSWNIYINKDEGFSIQYPKTWRQAYDGASPYLTPDPPCPPEGACGGLPRGIYFHFGKSAAYRSSLDYVENEVLLDNRGRPNPGFITKTQPSYFSNIDATVVDGLGGAGCPGPTAYIRSKYGVIIELSSDYCLKDGTISFAVISKIFSTFKFTNE